VAATGPGRGQPGTGAFADQVAFELSQGGEDVEDELAARRGGVDCLLEAAEPNPTLGQARDGADQMSEGAAEGGRVPDDQGVAGPQRPPSSNPGLQDTLTGTCGGVALTP
jgi:hypothetical protein